MGGSLWRGLAFAALASLTAAATPLSHAERATRAIANGGYAVSSATNACPHLTTDLLGWPAAKVRHCAYQVADSSLDHPRAAVVYLLDLDGTTLAHWIENACANVDADAETCFSAVLRAGAGNSGYMIPIAGNILEDMSGEGWKNYFFRNGMTASVRRDVNGHGDELALDDQETLSQNGAVLSIPSGMTRPWRTTPAEFSAHFPAEGAAEDLHTEAGRAHWLDRTKTELLAAIGGDHNRLLEAWVCGAAGQQITGAACK
jgi:hypothetical protein